MQSQLGMSAAIAALGRISHALRSRARLGDVAKVMSMRSMALAGNIGCGLLTAAALGPAGRGEQTALGLAPLVLAAASTLGLHASLIFNMRADPKHASHYFGAALAITCITGLLVAGVAYFLLPIWLAHYGAVTIGHGRLFLLSVPFGVVTPLLSGVLEANGRFAKASRVLYLQSLSTLVLLASMMLLHALTPFRAASAYIVPSLGVFFYLLWQAVNVLRPAFKASVPFAKRLLHFGLKFYGVDILGAFSGYLDQIIIVYLLSPAATGAYAVALSVSRILTVIQGSLATVLFPSIAGREAKSVIETVGRATRISFVVNMCAAVMIGVTGPSLLIFGYGARFAPAIAPFLILLAEAVMSSAARTLSQSFSGTGRPGAVTAMEVVGVACSLIAMLLLIPRFGLVGAAGGSLLGGCARLAWVLGTFRAVLGMRLPRLVMSRDDLAWAAGR